MTKLKVIMMLLPFLFMVHEYEEIIMFKNWLRNNRNELGRRFARLEQSLAHRGYFDYSTATFALGTAHEFILISIASYCAVWLDAYQWWFAAFAGYSLHLMVHLVQWAIYRKYIPTIITTIVSLPYCIYAFDLFSKSSVLYPLQMSLWAVVGIILTVLSLLSASFLMGRFQRWQDKY